jgi:hypothetical protein
MPTLSLNVANDIANAILKFYARGKTLSQTMQDRPLLRFLTAGKKNFPGGNQYVSDPVQGAYMADQNNVALGGGAFFQGYTEDAQLSFAQAANILRAEYKWYECHAGLVITWTELKKDGITISDNSKKSEHSDMALTRLTGLLENRMDDYGESWARAVNLMLWQDGTQDPNQIPGVQALLPQTTGSGVVGGLSRATYSWWNHVLALGIPASAAGQTLSKAIRSKQRTIRRYGGKPNKFLCGSAFLDGLELEVAEKGLYTMEGFTTEKATDIMMGQDSTQSIGLRGVGRFEWDPTLDDLGQSKFCYEFSSNRIALRDMEGEWNKVLTPERPYQYMVFLKSMTITGALQVRQLNAHGVFSVA